LKRKYDVNKVCMDCELEGEELNLADYPVTYKHGAWRPCLYRIFNLWFCPRCGKQHYNGNFFNKKKTWKHL